MGVHPQTIQLGILNISTTDAHRKYKKTQNHTTSVWASIRYYLFYNDSSRQKTLIVDSSYHIYIYKCYISL